MTASAMSTVSAALKRFAGFLIFNHTADCKPYNSRYDCQYNCCSYVINSLQFKLLFSFYILHYSTTLLHSLRRLTYIYFQRIRLFVWPEQKIQETDHQK